MHSRSGHWSASPRLIAEMMGHGISHVAAAHSLPSMIHLRPLSLAAPQLIEGVNGEGQYAFYSALLRLDKLNPAFTNVQPRANMKRHEPCPFALLVWPHSIRYEDRHLITGE